MASADLGKWLFAGLDLGIVNAEPFSKDAGLMVMPIPTLDASQTFVFDFTGVTGTLTIEGSKVFDDPVLYPDQKLAAQKFVYKGQSESGNMSSPASDSLSGLCKGGQFAKIAYVSDFYGTVYVKVNTVDVNLVEANGNYTLVRYRITCTMSK